MIDQPKKPASAVEYVELVERELEAAACATNAQVRVEHLNAAGFYAHEAEMIRLAL